MRKIPFTAGSLLSVLLWAPVAGAQRIAVPGPPPATQPEATSQPGTPAAAKPAAGETPANKAVPAQGTSAKPPVAPAAAAQHGKRRDPFHTLMPEKKPGEPAAVRLPAGKSGLVIEQLELKGIARAVDGSWIAVVDNKSKRAYFLHEKDQLYNGVVSKIMPDRVIFREGPAGAPSAQGAAREVVKALPPQ